MTFARNARIVILEQPATMCRFRYNYETSPNILYGRNSSKQSKTYPTIKVEGLVANAFVVISCVTESPPYRIHPANLRGKNCKNGIFFTKIPTDTMTVTLKDVSIITYKRCNITKSLTERETVGVDPFKNGYSHKSEASDMDFSSLRLAIQVFVEAVWPMTPDYLYLDPIVSDPITNRNCASKNFNIIKISECCCYPDGGNKDIIVLCAKLSKRGISLRFYEEVEGEIFWEASVPIAEEDIHKDIGITFRPPSYKNLNLQEVVTVFLQVERKSKDEQGTAIPFMYIPFPSKIERFKNKYIDFYAGWERFIQYTSQHPEEINKAWPFSTTTCSKNIDNNILPSTINEDCTIGEKNSQLSNDICANGTDLMSIENLSSILLNSLSISDINMLLGSE